MPDPPFETFLTSCVLNGLRQKRYHILVKNWIFDDPVHKKIPVMIILVPVMIRPSGNWALEAVEASEVAEGAEVKEAGEVSKAWKITTKDFRVF